MKKIILTCLVFIACLSVKVHPIENNEINHTWIWNSTEINHINTIKT